MYAVIRRYNIQRGTAPAVLDKVSNDFLAKVSQLPGFVAYHVIDPKDDTLVSITLFESKAEADESTRLSTDWVRSNLHQQLRSAPVITTGEVAITSATQLR